MRLGRISSKSIFLRFIAAVSCVRALSPKSTVRLATNLGWFGDDRSATAREKPSRGKSIANLDDLLAGEVCEANPGFAELGLTAGITEAAALECL